MVRIKMNDIIIVINVRYKEKYTFILFMRFIFCIIPNDYAE